MTMQTAMCTRSLVVLILTLMPIWAHAAETSRALEERLLADARDGDLDDLTLVEAALIASRVSDDKQRALYSAEFGQVLNELANQCSSEPAETRVKTVFRILHRRLLTGVYDARCSSLQATLDEGRFNCVSATILFHAMCEHVGLQPLIVSTPSHVFSRLEIAEIGDVQTTCAEWFRTPRVATLNRESEPDDLTSRRLITTVQLLGKVYYNAGVAKLESGQFAAAVSVLQVSTQLDADDHAAHDNLLAGLNNWSLAEEDAGRLPRAADLVKRGLSLEPTYAPLLANDLHIHQRWALELCDAGRFEQALQLLQRCHARRPEVQLFDMGRFAVVALWSESLFRGGRFAEAFRVLDGAQEMLSASVELNDYEESLVCRSVASLSRSGRREQALHLSTLGLERLPGSEKLLRQLHDLTQ